MSKIKEYDPIEAGLSELSRKYSVVHDVTTKEGYEQCKKDAREVGKYRISLEAVRKEIKGPALERCKDIDAEAKRIQAEIAKVEEPLKEAYKAIDEKKKIAEQERIDKIESKIEDIKSYVDRSYSANSNDLSVFIEIVDSIDCTEGFYEFTKQALIARNETLEHLNRALKQVIQKENDDKRRAEEQAELEELRKIKAEQEEKERQLENERREIEHQKELAEQAKQAELDKIEAEKRAQEAAKQAEIDKKLAEEAAAEKAKQAEIERQEREKQAEIEAKRKLEENKRHVAKICGQAKKSLMKIDGVDESLAKAIVQAIAKKEIANVTVNY
jgi:chemotaxis protein histidine kinase CheA